MRYDSPNQQNTLIEKAKKLNQVIKAREDYVHCVGNVRPMMELYSNAHRIRRSIDVFEEMKSLGHVKTSDYHRIIAMFLRTRRMGYAIQLHEEMTALGHHTGPRMLGMMIYSAGRLGYIQKGMEYLREASKKKILISYRQMRPMVYKTKPYPHMWEEMKALFVEAGLPTPLVKNYFPRILSNRERQERLEVGDGRVRISEPSAPYKSQKRLKPKKITISE